MTQASTEMSAPLLSAARGQPVVFWGGAALVLLGVASVVFPTIGPVVIGAMAGWLLWLAGAVMLLIAFFTRGAGFFGAVLTSLLAIAAGVYLLWHPQAGALAATIVVTAVFMLDGASQIVLALDLRPARAWRWVMASAVASIIAGVLIAAGVPTQSTIALSLLLGLAFITSGVAFMVLGSARGREA